MNLHGVQFSCTNPYLGRGIFSHIGELDSDIGDIVDELNVAAMLRSYRRAIAAADHACSTPLIVA